jgi:hypothetical protein
MPVYSTLGKFKIVPVGFKFFPVEEKKGHQKTQQERG